MTMKSTISAPVHSGSAERWFPVVRMVCNGLRSDYSRSKAIGLYLYAHMLVCDFEASASLAACQEQLR